MLFGSNFNSNTLLLLDFCNVVSISITGSVYPNISNKNIKFINY